MTSEKDSKEILQILKGSYINDVIKSIENVYSILKPYDIPRKTFIEAFNEVLTEAVRDEGEEWHYYFDTTELLNEILVYRTKIDPYHFTEIFNKYTDYSTSEINECIIAHCDVFDEPIEDYKAYSSGLDDY